MRTRKYLGVSAPGTAGGTCALITMGADHAPNLAIPRTTGMPHRPSSSDGHTSIFVSSNPTGRRYRLSKCARRYAGLSPLPRASVRLPFLSSLTAEGRCGMWRPYRAGKRVAIPEPVRHAISP
jgi:hypothetical protein